MNRMNEIAALLGIEMNKVFLLKNNDMNKVCINKYILREGGVYAIENNVEVYKNNIIEFIFQGKLEVYEPPFIPKKGQAYKYYKALSNGDLESLIKSWEGSTFDLINFKSGNYFGLATKTSKNEFVEELDKYYSEILKQNTEE